MNISFLRGISALFLFVLILSSCSVDFSKPIVSVDNPQSIITLQKGHFKAKYSPDGSKILLTDQSNNGLTVYDVSTKSLTVLTRKIDAGLEAGFTPDNENVYYITHDFSDKKRKSNLYVQNLTTGVKTDVVENVRNLKLMKSNADMLLFYEDGDLRQYNFKTKLFNTKFTDQIGVFSDGDLNLAVFNDRKSTLIQPSGEGDYIWVSLSPDKKNVLYTLTGKGSFICDLNGENVVSLGRLHAPKWSSDGKWVIGMDDYDDGKSFTKSDIYLITADGEKRQNLTQETDIIALYPEISPDGKQVLFSNEKGRVYEMNIE